MNNAIAVDPNPESVGNRGISRTTLAAVFVVGGLILLFLANRYVRRHHKGRRHTRY